MDKHPLVGTLCFELYPDGYYICVVRQVTEHDIYCEIVADIGYIGEYGQSSFETGSASKQEELFLDETTGIYYVNTLTLRTEEFFPRLKRITSQSNSC